jgi:outer membrane protein TolC
MADNDLSLKTQSTLYDIDQAYWTVVSLKQKQKLANSYYELVKKLDDDVKKMIKEGVATRADGLRVDVKVNEANMQITQVDDGLSLAKMLLCQLCGLQWTVR